MNPQILLDLKKLYPELVLTVTILCVVVSDLALPNLRKKVTFSLAALGLILAFIASVPLFAQPQGSAFYGVVAIDPMAAFFKCFLILTSFLVLLAAPKSREFSSQSLGEFYALLLAVTLGMLLLASSMDMLMLYLSLEMVSLGSYIMVAYLKNDRSSNEASLKYLLFGTIATGCMLYGFTIVYGLTGTTKIAGVRDILSASSAAGENTLILFVATTLILAGFGFKTAVAPFHFWCPDVYAGAPTPVTAFLSVGPKAAGFATLIRFFFTGLSSTSGDGLWAPFSSISWQHLGLIISVITMTLGNIAALRQENMKRLLAYSSIAHAGYILMGVVVLTGQGLQSVLVYLITYLFMNLGAFFIVIEIFNRTGSFDLKDYRGLYRRSPFLTIAMAIFMFSLMGIPPFAGFFGKLYVFGAAVNRNLAWFAVVGALNSVVAVYYYARVIKTMIIDTNEDTSRLSMPWPSHVLIWILLLPTVGMMLFWGAIQRLTETSTRIFLG
ncbi:MAG TPA: NADH-quinone oxidoreductase subunit N [Acidobacteriota bacterium]|nr:NADH-quinone oxidoreductase subunit N [Acidobacteriota bacterium]